MHGRIETTRIESECLRGNLLGDPHERDVYVYRPPNDDSGPRLPVVMLLPGFAATHRSMLGYNPWKPNTAEIFDALIQAGACPPAYLVMPDCMTRWGGSQFIDSPATGAYQTYLADEVIPHIDAHYHTVADRSARAVAGRSSGGFGALRLGMDRPDVVSVLGSHAGDAAFDVSMRPMLTSAAIGLSKAGGLGAFSGRVCEGGPRGSAEFDAVFVLASSAAYSPDPTGPFPHARLSFDERSGNLRPAVWEEWLAQDPITRIEASQAALKQMSLVYLDAGDADEHGLQFAARQLATALAELGVQVTHEEYAGGHRHTTYRYETSLPLMVGALNRE